MKLQKILLTSVCLMVSSLAIADMQVNHLQDYNFGEIDLHNTNQVNHSLCVFSDEKKDQGAYQVEIHSNGPNGRFEMTNGVSDIPYSVQWSPIAAGGAGYVNLTPNNPVHMENADKKQDCPTGDNANMQISVNPNALSSVMAGAYSASLFITVSPV